MKHEINIYKRPNNYLDCRCSWQCIMVLYLLVFLHLMCWYSK